MNLNQRIISLEDQLKGIIKDIKQEKYVSKETGQYLKDVEKKVELLRELVDFRTV